MRTHIALLRGINVGGRRKVLMADLRSLLEDLGFTNVLTYIQSGNVAFNTNTEKDLLTISNTIEEAILKKYDFSVPCIVRTSESIKNSYLNNPYIKDGNAEIESLFLTFLKSKPSPENIEAIASFDFLPDSFEIIDNDVYGFCSKKYHESKISNNFFEKKLKTEATTRNWKTVKKLIDLAEKPSA